MGWGVVGERGRDRERGREVGRRNGERVRVWLLKKNT